MYSFDIVYSGDANFNGFTSGNYKLNITKADPVIVIIDDDVDYGQNATVTVVLPDNAQGTVTVNVNGDSCTVPISGSATLKYNNLVAGDYTVSVIYSGDDNFNGNSASSSFKVNKIDFVPGVSVSDIYYGQNASVVVSFNSDVSGVVSVTVDGVTKSLTASSSVVFDGLAVGTYDVSVS